jgi:hypothetical protein
LPATSKGEGIAGQGEACRFRRRLRGNTHSSHGGRKAYLNFELKVHWLLEAARQSKSDLSDFDIVNADLRNGRDRCAVLDFKVQIRSGLPCDERGGAGVALRSSQLLFGMGLKIQSSDVMLVIRFLLIIEVLGAVVLIRTKDMNLSIF